ncbi:MAG: Na+/H+ antiporter NhaC family protein [Acidobacteriota bacterium]
MRRSLFLLFAVLSSLLAADPSEARTPRLAIEVPMVVAGAPLQFEVEVSNVRRSQLLVAQVLVDGRVVESRIRLKNGSNTVKVDFRPSSGDHTLELRSSSLSEKTEFSLLPGWLSVIPPLVAIALALIFRDVLIALFLGVFVGALSLNGWNPFAAFGRTIDGYIVPALADADHISILVFTSLLGGMVGLITKSGGTHGIVEMLTPYATSSRRGQVATWFMGLLIFFDDYANTLIVGPTMRPITDRLRISREKLAYLVDSTAAPVVCLFPISTWVGFEIGLIGSAFEALGLGVDPYTTFVASIPYRFYPIFALIMVLSIAALGRDFGPMRAAERRARRTGQLLAPGAQPIADYSTEEVEPPADAPKRALNAILPILVVVVVTILGIFITGRAGLDEASAATEGAEYLRLLLGEANSYHALLWSSLSGMLTALALAVGQRILPIREAMNAMLAGIKAMLLALLVLTMAWSLAAVCEALSTADYLVGLSAQSLSPGLLPALTFVLAAAVAFATGSSWGTMAILEPLIIPIAHQLSISAGLEPGGQQYLHVMLGSIAAVLTGAVWGDHCSPISDTTILSSMASGCDHIAHVRTQLPYALLTGILAILFSSLPAGLGISPWIPLAIGAAAIILGVRFVGRETDGDEDPEPDREESDGKEPEEETADEAQAA